jgi:hypothetical protein
VPKALLVKEASEEIDQMTVHQFSEPDVDSGQYVYVPDNQSFDVS